MANNKKHSNSPYKDYSIEDLMKLESNLFTIQVGEDFFSSDNSYTFTRKRAENYYSQIYNGLLDSLYSGNPEEKVGAMSIFENFRMQPLRIH